MITTFHTLGKTKIESGSVEPNQRLVSEREIIGCSEIVVANSENEQQQLRNLYDAPSERIKIVPLGVEQALFSPGNQNAAREALHLPTGPILLFVGRLQPLKGVDIAIATLQKLKNDNATLVVVGGKWPEWVHIKKDTLHS